MKQAKQMEQRKWIQSQNNAEIIIIIIIIIKVYLQHRFSWFSLTIQSYWIAPGYVAEIQLKLVYLQEALDHLRSLHQ